MTDTLQAGRDFELPAGDITTLFDAPREKPRVLVVDDQAIQLQLLHQLFQVDYQVFIATNGRRALDICRDNPPDLVLLDVEMPGMDGFEVCARLQADEATRHIPVIFLTGHSDPQEETRGLGLGAVDFIAKPVNPAVVRARVRTHLTLKRQSDSMRRLAFLDGLTGVYNRRYFDQQLPIEVARAQRNESPLSVMMLDVDCFKAYNDFYGHQAGDDCLKAVARCLAPHLRRPADLLARYGGEEFVCVLPDTPFDAALAMACQMEADLRALAIPHQGSTAADRVTLSIGVSGREGGTRCEAAQLLERADEALYKAKKSGRGRALGARLEPT